MTQAQFLRSLSRKLRGLPAAEREEALRYYREYLQDAELAAGADVTPLVGTPAEAARGLLADRLIRQEQEAKVSSGWRSFWLVVLGIFAAPVALPLAIVAVALLIVVFAVLLSLIITGVALVLGGAAMLPAAFFAATLGQGLVVAGYGLLTAAVGALLALGAVVLWRMVVRGMASLLRLKGADHA